MKKKIVFAGIVLIMMCSAVAVAFADDDDEYEYLYTVEVVYNTKRFHSNGTPIQDTESYTFWASSVSEARQIALERCEREKGNAASCGGAIVIDKRKKR